MGLGKEESWLHALGYYTLDHLDSKDESTTP